jgi:hypothetical protein
LKHTKKKLVQTHKKKNKKTGKTKVRLAQIHRPRLPNPDKIHYLLREEEEVEEKNDYYNLAREIWDRNPPN